eukprot:766665-Hanusia_phi.AAC.8
MIGQCQSRAGGTSSGGTPGEPGRAPRARRVPVRSGSPPAASRAQSGRPADQCNPAGPQCLAISPLNRGLGAGVIPVEGWVGGEAGNGGVGWVIQFPVRWQLRRGARSKAREEGEGEGEMREKFRNFRVDVSLDACPLRMPCSRIAGGACCL